MKRLLFLLLLASPAAALPPANNEHVIQPTEIHNWACNFPVTVDSIVSHTVTLRDGTDADCPAGAAYVCTPAGLITSPTVSTTFANFTITPAGKASGNVYQVDVLVEDALGQRFMCNGKVTVRAVRVVL